MRERNYLLGAMAAMTAGAVWAASSVIQVFGQRNTGEEVEGFSGHAILTLFTIALLLMVPAMFALARHAKDALGARIAAPGLIVLGLTCIVSNVQGEDPSFFVVVAPITNLLWLVGSIALAVSLHKAGRVPRWVAIGLPLMQVFALPLSAIGGSIVTGGFWLAVGYLMRAGALEQRAERTAPVTA